MNRFSTLLIMVLFCLPVFADPIPLDPKDPPILGGGGRDWDKSEILVPNAEIENGVINVETALASWGVSVTVYNNDGAVVYTSVSVIESQSHNFAVGTLPSGDYTLEVQIGEDLYEGTFVQ